MYLLGLSLAVALPTVLLNSLESPHCLAFPPQRVRFSRPHWREYEGSQESALCERGLRLPQLPPVLCPGEMDRILACAVSSVRLSWGLDRCLRRGAHGRGNVSSVTPANRNRFFTPLVLCLVSVSITLDSNCAFADEPARSAVKVLVAYHSLSGNTERMAEAVVEGAKSLPGTTVVLKRVGQVTAEDLFSSDALIIGSPVYWSNMSGEVKTFLDNWQFKFGVFPEFKMKNKIGAAFATGGQVSSGKEVTMLTILAAMLGNQMIVVSGGGAFGASATTEGDSPGIDNKELADAKALGRRVAEVAVMMKRVPAQ